MAIFVYNLYFCTLYFRTMDLHTKIKHSGMGSFFTVDTNMSSKTYIIYCICYKLIAKLSYISQLILFILHWAQSPDIASSHKIAKQLYKNKFLDTFIFVCFIFVHLTCIRKLISYENKAFYSIHHFSNLEIFYSYHSIFKRI